MALLAQLQTTTGQDWWWSTLTSGPALWLLGCAVMCLVILLWLGVRLRAVSAHVRKVPIRERLADDSGVAMIEFVLVTPILLFVTLLLVQTMLVFTGLFYVQYAAYAAARTAIVVIPSDLDLPPNDMDLYGDKAGLIGASSALALMPVSGRESSTDNTSLDVGPLLEQGFASMYNALGKSQPPWVNEMLAQRFYYAANHTEIEMHRVYPGDGPQTVRLEGVEGYTTFGPKDAIAVTVHHEFALTVPLASRVFSAVGESGSYSPAGRDSDSPGPPGQWTKISSRAILTNEGIDRRLPEAPDVPRR
jgi:hypothetical protein